MSEALVVITDLDGTLLDHYTYAYTAAMPALELLEQKHIPLVLCSSKTAAEMTAIRAELGCHAPFIVENGAAIYLPTAGRDGEEQLEIVGFGMNRADVLGILKDVKQKEGVKFTGFSDMSVKDVMACTGLDESSAADALQREFTEPVLWQDSEEKRRRFITQVAKQGLSAVQGGRFLHFSAQCDKGKAVVWLRNYYGRDTGKPPHIIALGDSENDVGMLEEADVPVLVKSPVKPFPAVKRDNVYKTRDYGPAGWNEALMKILQHLQQQAGEQ